MSETTPPLDDPNAPGQPQTQTAVLERTETTPQVAEPGDHERFAHYVRKEKILESALSGEPVTALCGKVWVPGRDPKRFPVCPTCKESPETLGLEAGDGWRRLARRLSLVAGVLALASRVGRNSMLVWKNVHHSQMFSNCQSMTFRRAH